MAVRERGEKGEWREGTGEGGKGKEVSVSSPTYCCNVYCCCAVFW